MKKSTKIVLALVISALAVILIAGVAFAQGPQSAAPQGQNNGAGARFGQVGGPAWGHDATFDAVTKLTGLTEEEIIAGRQAGQSLAEIVASKNVSEDALVNEILASKKAVLDGLVADGKITQNQADLMLSRMTEQVTASVERTDVGPRWGSRGGRGGMGGRGLGTCVLSQTVAQ